MNPESQPDGSLGGQRNNRIDACGAACGNQRSRQGNDCEKNRHAAERDSIRSTYAEEQGFMKRVSAQAPASPATLDLAANYKASYERAISHFLDRLADGGPFETSPEDNLKTLAIVEAAYLASR